MIAAARRPHRRGGPGPRSARPGWGLGLLRRGAAPLVALTAVVAVAVSGTPHDAPPARVDAGLASFADPAPPARVDLRVLDGRLSASWPDSGESKVRGYRVTAASGSTTKDFGEQQSGYVLNGLANGTAWTVSVRTVTYDGGLIGIGAQGPNTGTVSATSTATPLALPPTGVSMASADRQLTLSWTAPADSTVNGYRIYSGGQQIASVGASTTSLTRGGLVNGQTYTATVRATYSSGAVSADSATSSGVPRDAVAPAAPTGLVASRGDGRVALSWAAGTEYDIRGYRVLRNGTEVGTTSAGTRSYSDTGLTNDTSYSYALQALDTSDNESPVSSPAVSATPTDLTPPAVPTGLAATRGDGQVSLGWTANAETDLASYRVLRGGAVVATVNTPATTFTDTGLTNDTAYEYSLQAVDTHGNASAASSPAVRATPTDLTPPAVPTGLAAVRGDGQVSLTWTANTEGDLAGYDLFRDGVRAPGAVLGAGATSYTDTGLTNDRTYSYALRARDTSGNTSAVSSPAVSATPTDLTPPAVPTGLSAVSGDGVVSLSWTANPETDLATYRVLRGGAVIATVTEPGTTFSDGSVTNGTAYAYTLQAVDTHGNASAASAPPVSAAPRDLTPPATPTGLAATRGDTRVVLSWTAGTENDLASYRVLRDGVVMATVTAPTTSFTDTGLTNDTTYGYAVAAYDTAGNGSAASSPAVSATPTDLTPPAPPSGVTSTAGDGVVDVTWNANTEADLGSYRVYRDGALVAAVRLASPPGSTSTSFHDSGLADGVAHTYAVTAVDTHGNESTASTTSATPVDTTPPGAASGLGATPSDRQVALSWTASPASDVATYRVLRDGVEVATVTAPTTSSTDASLTNGRAYAYSVVAVDTAGNRSTASGTTTATPRDAVAPAAPTAVSATPGSGSAIVRWTAPADTDLATYRVLRADGSVAATAPAPATSAVVNGLTNGTPSTFTVVVVDTSGNTSAASTSVSVTPTATTVPAQGAGQSGALAVSPDGRWLVVATTSPLESADTNGAQELYRIDTTGQVPPRRVAPIAAGGPTAQLNASDVAVSADGRYVVLSTTVSLSGRSTGGQLNVYRGDLSTTPTTWALVSVPASGVPSTAVPGTVLQTGSAVYATSPGLAVSADGSRVLFYSGRDDLVAGDGDGGVDVFAKDLRGSDPSLGPVTRVSTGTGGGALGRTATGPALALTPDGRYAVFTATGPSGPLVVLRKDLGTAAGSPASASGPVVVVSSTPAGSATGGSQVAVSAYRDTGDVAISDDGRYVAFVSAAKLTSATPTALASTGLAYRKDLTTGAVAALGTGQTTVWEHQVGLSPDGSFGTFSTTAGLVPSDTNGHTDVYGRDLASGGPLVLATSASSGSAVASPSAPVSSAEYGRTKVLAGGVVLAVTVQPLVTSDTNGTRDVYRKDLTTGAVVALVAS